VPATVSLKNLLSDTYQTLATDSTSVFAQGTIHATDRLSVSIGVRETYESKSASIDRTAPELDGQPAATVPRSLAPYSSGPLGERDYGLSGLLSVDYKINKQVLAYASASRGEKSGGINPSVPPQIAGSNPIQYLSAQDTLYISPEKANDIELGFKTTSWQERVLFNVDIYKTLVKNYQATGIIQSSPGVFTQTLQNVGYVRTQGVESQLQFIPVKGLSFDLTASYNDAIYKSFYNAQCSAEVKAVDPTATFCSLTGSQVVGAPRWIVNPSFNLNHRLFDDVRGYSLFSYAWRSSFFGAPDDSLYSRIPAYGLANLRLGVTGEIGSHGWDVSVFANNAFDKHYSPGGLGVTQYNAYSEFAGQPRIVGGTVRLDF
jgi:iron complex outermembrane receptor protein